MTSPGETGTLDSMPTTHAGAPLADSASAPQRHVDTEVRRIRTARRWCAALLSLATTALVGYVAVVVGAMWVYVSVFLAALGKDAPAADLGALATGVLPGLLVGWCLGMAAATVLGRGTVLGPRAAGTASGLLGALAAATVLWATGLV